MHGPPARPAGAPHRAVREPNRAAPLHAGNDTPSCAPQRLRSALEVPTTLVRALRVHAANGASNGRFARADHVRVRGAHSRPHLRQCQPDERAVVAGQRANAQQASRARLHMTIAMPAPPPVSVAQQLATTQRTRNATAPTQQTSTTAATTTARTLIDARAFSKEPVLRVAPRALSSSLPPTHPLLRAVR